jgi:hypothetical protein
MPQVNNPQLGHNRHDRLFDEITLFIGDKRLADAMEREAIAQLEGAQRFFALGKSLIPNAIRWAKLNPQMSAALPLLIIITHLADNNDGCCWLTIPRMAQLLERSERSIRSCLLALERDGLLHIERSEGLPSRYWPSVPTCLTQIGVSALDFVNALSSRPGGARKEHAAPGAVQLEPDHPGRPLPGSTPEGGRTEPRKVDAPTPEGEHRHSILSNDNISKSINRGEAQPSVAKPTPYRNRDPFNLNVHETESHRDCHWHDDRLMVLNDFRAELEAMLGTNASDLDLVLIEVAGRVGPGTRGWMLRTKVRAEVARIARIRADHGQTQVRRWGGGAQSKTPPARKSGVDLLPPTQDEEEIARRFEAYVQEAPATIEKFGGRDKAWVLFRKTELARR